MRLIKLIYPQLFALMSRNRSRPVLLHLNPQLGEKLVNDLGIAHLVDRNPQGHFNLGVGKDSDEKGPFGLEPFHSNVSSFEIDTDAETSKFRQAGFG
jgi:hypothetical protein